MKLGVNRQKSRVVKASQVEVLGFVFRRGTIRWSERSFERFKMARTPVTQQAMSNQWLAEQGLISVRDLWVALHYR